MATTYNDYTGDGNATKDFNFPLYTATDVKVEVDNVIKDLTTQLDTIKRKDYNSEKINKLIILTFVLLSY